MKKTFFLLIALFYAVGLANSQSLESLGDEAFLNGNYIQAEKYYQRANDLDPSKTLKDKIKKSRELKNEFEIIDRAIVANEFDKARLHINNVLIIDPGNLWANERRKRVGNKQSKERLKGFDGEYYNLDIRRGFSLSGGLRYDIYEEMLCPMIKLSYLNYKRFPYTIDFSIQLYNYSYNNDMKLGSFGMGSAYILSKNWTIDYGSGVMWEIKDHRYVGPYIKAGITFGYFLSYYWCHGFSIGYSSPINAQFLVLTYIIPFETRWDSTH